MLRLSPSTNTCLAWAEGTTGAWRGANPNKVRHAGRCRCGKHRIGAPGKHRIGAPGGAAPFPPTYPLGTHSAGSVYVGGSRTYGSETGVPLISSRPSLTSTVSPARQATGIVFVVGGGGRRGVMPHPRQQIPSSTSGGSARLFVLKNPLHSQQGVSLEPGVAPPSWPHTPTARRP